MSQNEQIQVNHLQEELESANRNAEEVRAYFSSALDRSNDEAKLYRGLFWGLLTLAAVVAMLQILQP